MRMRKPKDDAVEDSACFGNHRWNLRNEGSNKMPRTELTNKTDNGVWGPSDKPKENTCYGDAVDLGFRGNLVMKSKSNVLACVVAECYKELANGLSNEVVEVNYEAHRHHIASKKEKDDITSILNCICTVIMYVRKVQFWNCD